RGRGRRCGGSEPPLGRASAGGGGGGTWGSDAVQQVVDRLGHGVSAAAGEEVLQHLADVGGDVLRVVPVARRAHDVADGQQRDVRPVQDRIEGGLTGDLWRRRRDARLPRLVVF